MIAASLCNEKQSFYPKLHDFKSIDPTTFYQTLQIFDFYIRFPPFFCCSFSLRLFEETEKDYLKSAEGKFLCNIFGHAAETWFLPTSFGAFYQLFLPFRKALWCSFLGVLMFSCWVFVGVSFFLPFLLLFLGDFLCHFGLYYIKHLLGNIFIFSRVLQQI